MTQVHVHVSVVLNTGTWNAHNAGEVLQILPLDILHCLKAYLYLTNNTGRITS